MSPSVIAGEFAGRYTVERELGRGATSTVWLARDREHGRPVALKILREELATDIAAERFLREVRVTAQLHHPQIVPVLNSGTHEGRLFFVLPYLDGGTLRARLERDKQLPVAEVVAIGLTIASALASAHEKNVLHRDVKPENILFTAGQACLADFGIARAIVHASGESTTSTGLVRGTPAYMSPEQASGDRDYDGRSDLYSLACVLYEALAGVPAFVGATSQQIVAQRLLHEPRPVRVFRPSVSVELEAVLAKALATSPADRYQSANEFAEALSAAPAGYATEPSSVPSKRRLSRPLFMLFATFGVAVAAYLIARAPGTILRWRGAALDTTRVVVLPIEASDDAATTPGDADLLVAGLERWTGLEVVEDFVVADAVRRHGEVRSTQDGQRIARDLSAGRFVRSKFSGAGPSRLLEIALYDVRSGDAVYHRRFTVPGEATERARFFAGVADSLVLRGSRDEPPNEPTLLSRNAPAAQAFLAARAKLRDWDLAAAESLFDASTKFDEAPPRAYLWLAQIRVWRLMTFDPVPWRAAAARAFADSMHLSVVERAMANGLRALADSNFVQACATYRAIIRRDSASFVGWYGLAQCHDLDHAVIRDPAAAGGVRFRSSYHQAIEAYARAFELMPSSFGGFADGAFTSIRAKFYTNTRTLRSGYDRDDRSRFYYARPSISGDSIVFVPVLREAGTPIGSLENLAAAKPAVARLRTRFRRIAEGWAAALPNAPGAKEALAVSLEVLGDPAAADSFASVARQATDAHQRLRAAVAATLMRVKVAIPDDPSALRAARQRAESILAVARPTSTDDAELLARLAALIGRCGQAAEYSRAAASPVIGSVFLSRGVMAGAQAHLAFASLGCAIPRGTPSLDDIFREIESQQTSDAARRAAPFFALGGVIHAMFPADSVWILRVQSTSDLRAELAWLRGQPAVARAILDSAGAIRATSMPGNVTPDVALIEARMWLVLGDSAAARRTLDRSLLEARYYAPMTARESAGNLFIIASLVRAARLRSWIAGRDAAIAAKWTTAYDALWANADVERRP